jgi:hypothetical protein
MASIILNGINWADERDNFVDHFIVPSGLDSTDTFAASYTKHTFIFDSSAS